MDKINDIKGLNNTILKKLTLLVVCFLLTVATFAQTTDFNQVVPGEESRPRTFEDYLVQLAWNNSPNGKVLSNQQAIAGLETDLTKRDWMKNASVQWNLNEISLSNIIYPDNELFVALPIWNVTASVDMDLLFNRKKKIQISKQKEEIVQQNINYLKLQTRAAVLDAYNAYLLTIDILKVRKEAEQFSFQTRTLVTELFEQNKAEFEDVSRAAESYAKAREGVLEAESNIRQTRIALEELIGIPLEQAERLGAAYKRE